MRVDDLRHISSSYLATRHSIGLKDIQHKKLIDDFLKHIERQQIAGETIAPGIGLGLFNPKT